MCAGEKKWLPTTLADGPQGQLRVPQVWRALERLRGGEIEQREGHAQGLQPVRAVERLEPRPLAVGDGERHGLGRRQQRRSVIHNRVQQPRGERLLVVDGRARQHHLTSQLQPHQPRQALRASEAREDPELELREAKLRALCRDPGVAGQRDLEAPSQGESPDGGDGGLGPGLEELAKGVVDPVVDAAAAARFRELVDVEAGGEGLGAAARDDDGLGGRGGVGAAEAVEEGGED